MALPFLPGNIFDKNVSTDTAVSGAGRMIAIHSFIRHLQEYKS